MGVFFGFEQDAFRFQIGQDGFLEAIHTTACEAAEAFQVRPGFIHRLDDPKVLGFG